MSEIIKVEDDATLKEFADFMGSSEKIYEIMVPVEAPDGRLFQLPIVYSPATAYTIAKIYEDMSRNATTEDIFDRMCDLFNHCIKNWTFISSDTRKADIMSHEINIRELIPDSRTRIERAIAPGLGKSNDEYQQELKTNRRKVGKGMRKPSA